MNAGVGGMRAANNEARDFARERPENAEELVNLVASWGLEVADRGGAEGDAPTPGLILAAGGGEPVELKGMSFRLSISLRGYAAREWAGTLQPADCAREEDESSGERLRMHPMKFYLLLSGLSKRARDPEVTTGERGEAAQELCDHLAQINSREPDGVSLLAWIYLRRRSASVEPEARRDTAILPALPRITAGDPHPDLVRGRDFLDAGAKELPTWERKSEVTSPVMEFVDRSGLPIRSKGRGAPVAARFAIQALLSFPHSERGRGRAHMALTVRDFTDAFYPNYRRGRHWPKLREAMLEADQSAIVMEDSKAWPFRFLVLDRLPPVEEGAPDDIVSFEVRLPPGIANGPPIDLEALNRLGARSSPEYFALLGASAANYHPGRTRVPIGKGQWRWSRKHGDYPVLSLADLRRLAFGPASRKNHMNAQIVGAYANLPGWKLLEGQRDRKTGKEGYRLVCEFNSDSERSDVSTGENERVNRGK